MNVDKSKVKKEKEGEAGHLTIPWKGKQLEQVVHVSGNYDNINGKVDEKVNNRVQKAKQVYYQLNNAIIGKRKIGDKTKMTVLKTVYIPTQL